MKTCSLCDQPPSFIRDDLLLCEQHAEEVEACLGSLSHALKLSPIALDVPVDRLLHRRPRFLAA